jgi:eukaryotic-like serine/threonine-protein kinase
MATLPRSGRRKKRVAVPVAPGTRTGVYTIEKMRSQGGFGAVYEARRDDGVRVAIKIMHAELVATDQAVARFEREVDAIRRIRHPHVVDVLGVGRLDDGRPWFAMELVDGEDLATLIQRRGRLSASEAIAILGPICDALAAAHDVGVVHRDVKPANVLVIGDRPVLVDFGVAKLLDADAGLTTSRQAIGTPAFMAPEQGGGGEAVDGRADVYAVGALAFYLLTGAPPFSHRSRTMLLYLHKHARRQRPSSRAPVPPAIDDVIVRAMATDPAARYPTVRSLWAALETACAGSEARVGRTIGCRVRLAATAAGAALDDDEATDAIVDAHAEIAAWLGGAGFTLAVDGTRSQLWVRPADGDLALVLAAAQAAVRELERRRGPVAVRTELRVGEAAWQDGRAVGGPLLDLWTWGSVDSTDSEEAEDSAERLTLLEEGMHP